MVREEFSFSKNFSFFSGLKSLILREFFLISGKEIFWQKKLI